MKFEDFLGRITLKDKTEYREETQLDGSIHAIWEFYPSRELLESLLLDIFENYYDQVIFGPCIQGAVFECHTKQPPKKINYLDGYLTVNFGEWHIHLCIGDHHGDKHHPCPPELAEWRRCKRGELTRMYTNPPIAGHAPLSYSMALFNGRNEQMISFFLPNPFLTDKFRVTKSPDWSRLKLWNHIRIKFLKLDEDLGPFEDLA